jgi:diadenosine tetraphosphate (Ap4A) HIT family hydrolase
MTSSLSDKLRSPRTQDTAQQVVYEDDVAVVLVDSAPSRRSEAWVVPKAQQEAATGVDERTGMHLFKLAMRAAQSLLVSASDEVQVLLEGLTTADPHVLVRVLPRGGTTT